MLKKMILGRYGWRGWFFRLLRQTLLKSVYVACGLLLAAALLTAGLIGGLHNSYFSGIPFLAAKPKASLPPLPVKAGVQHQPARAAADPAKPAMPAVVKDNREVRIASAVKERPSLPLAGEVFCEYGWQENPGRKEWRFHTGIDVRSQGETRVRAAYSGTVTDIFTDRRNGLTVAVSDGTTVVYYGSLAKVAVAKAAVVAAGDVVGQIGSCPGEAAIHLHLAVKQDDKYINPQSFLYNGNI